MRRVRHGHIELAVHELRYGAGLPLILVHELGSDSSAWALDSIDWPGPVLGVDLSGHGASARLKGGCYMPEYWAADVDAVLLHRGAAALLGAGVGAYVALLAAAARSEQVPIVGLVGGEGLVGGGTAPDLDSDIYSMFIQPQTLAYASGADPQVRRTNSLIRPPDYVAPLAAHIARIVMADAGAQQAPWWDEVRRCDATVAVRGGLAEVSAAMVGYVGREIP